MHATGHHTYPGVLSNAKGSLMAGLWGRKSRAKSWKRGLWGSTTKGRSKNLTKRVWGSSKRRSKGGGLW